jgi:hypothetical protein
VQYLYLQGGGDDLEKKFPASLYIMNKKISALTNWGGGEYPSPVFGGEKNVAKQHGCRDRRSAGLIFWD